MKKIIISMAAIVLSFASCNITKESATTAKFPAPLNSATVADLNVAPQRISYTMKPGKALIVAEWRT